MYEWSSGLRLQHHGPWPVQNIGGDDKDIIKANWLEQTGVAQWIRKMKHNSGQEPIIWIRMWHVSVQVNDETANRLGLTKGSGNVMVAAMSGIPIGTAWRGGRSGFSMNEPQQNSFDDITIKM